MGHTLTANSGTWTGTEPIIYAYQWESCNGSGTECEAIEEAVSQTYKLRSSDLERAIRAIVIATNAGGATSATSDHSAEIAAGTGSSIAGYYATGETLPDALERLNGEISSDGGSIDGLIEHYGGNLPTTSGDDVEQAFDRVVATDYALQNEYGNLIGETLPERLGLSSDGDATTLLETQATKIKELSGGIENTMADSGSESGVDLAAGGQTADLGGATIGLANPLAISAALLPVFGYLTYEDIATGTNPVTTLVESFFSNESSEGAAAPPSAETDTEPRWLYVPKITHAELQEWFERESYTPKYNLQSALEYDCAVIRAHKNCETQSPSYAPRNPPFDEVPPPNPERPMMLLIWQEWEIGQALYAGGELNEKPGSMSSITDPLDDPDNLAESESAICKANEPPEYKLYGTHGYNSGIWQTGDVWPQGMRFMYTSQDEEASICTYHFSGPEPIGERSYEVSTKGSVWLQSGYVPPSDRHLAFPRKVSSLEVPEGTEQTKVAAPGSDKDVRESLKRLEAKLREGEDETGRELLEEAETEGRVPGTTTVPNCQGFSLTTCKTVLKDAGFTATPEVEELNWGTADIDVKPEHVVRTTPTAGSHTEDAKTMKIILNPSSTTIKGVEEALMDHNELDEEKAQKVAERCLQGTMRAGKTEAAGAEVCEKLPIFLPGSEVGKAAEHDAKAISAEPKWVQLNYESAAAKERKKESRAWYTEFGGCPGTPEAGDQCDEYPFFASAEGGPPSVGKPMPSLEYVNGTQNELEGSQYSGFLAACRVEEGGAFLVVPQPELPTSRLCNKE